MSSNFSISRLHDWPITLLLEQAAHLVACLREQSEHWLERNEEPDLLTAYDCLKSFPEHPPIERAG